MTGAGRPAELPDLAFVVGCPRSGTTWLQLLLAQHPAVATVKESHLVDHFLGPALQRWDELGRDPRRLGLGDVMSRKEFVERLRCFSRDVLTRIASGDTRLVVDKTPDHALWTGALREVFPNSRVLHLIRDPRDVAASLMAASEAWGTAWAPGSAYSAAWRWTEYVEGARAADRGPEHYRELRYEDLHADPEAELARLLDWLDLEASAELVGRAVDETAIDRMKRGATAAPWDLEQEPEGFVRKGGPGNWRADLSGSEARLVEYMCGELMDEFGYAPVRRRRIPPLRFFPPWLRDQIRRRI